MLTRHLAVLSGAKEVKDHQHFHLKTGKTEIRGLGLSHTDDPAGKGTLGPSAGPIIGYTCGTARSKAIRLVGKQNDRDIMGVQL